MSSNRILKEAQILASKFPFWMVSGNISHLYGHAYENSDIKYDLEIKFSEDFPNSPPSFIYHNTIKDLLGDFQLNTLKNWTSNSTTINIIEELRDKIQKTLNSRDKKEKFQLGLNSHQLDEEIFDTEKNDQDIEKKSSVSNTEDYVTPDLQAFPPDFDYNIEDSQPNLNYEMIYNNQKAPKNISQKSLEKTDNIDKFDTINVEIRTELSLIQQYYTFDQKGENPANIKVYLPITLTKTFDINIDFTDYPQKPKVILSEDLKAIIGDPNTSLDTLNKWNSKKLFHILDILHELEHKLLFLGDIESESNKILGEFKGLIDEKDSTKLHIRIITYGFKEYLLDLDFKSYPNPPHLINSPELQQIIQIPINNLSSCKNWKKGKSETVEIIREISWLIDKNSRINFELDLLKAHYKDLIYDTLTRILNIHMQGKMKTQDITFKFQIELPHEYPMKMPSIKLLNEFELETHQKIKEDLQTSFKSFLSEWSPYSYLIDLFNSIAKKIFEVSVVACVICHKIECPTCSIKIADSKESCNIVCPHCERAYHKHCWEQTIKNFGKCGFCLKAPPSNMIF